jgi:hypothetical protein
METIERHVPNVYAAFEEPQIRPILPPPFDQYERRLRRRFIETHELLGRGKVLEAFETGDYAYIETIAARRLKAIDREMHRRGASIYVDASKFFARGLHVGFMRRLGRISVIHLVRDPLRNMRSFLNRSKSFRLDNSMPSARSNLLRLESKRLEPGELYLWAWCELYLRYLSLRESPQVTHAIEIRTEDLESAARMNAALDTLELSHSPVVPLPPRNTNESRGLPATRVTAADIMVFEKFLDRVPPLLRERIAYLAAYDPWVVHGIRRTEAA